VEGAGVVRLQRQGHGVVVDGARLIAQLGPGQAAVLVDRRQGFAPVRQVRVQGVDRLRVVPQLQLGVRTPQVGRGGL
jgi:hypothetical protein